MKVKELTPEQVVYHPEHGELEYIGLLMRDPWLKEPCVPHKHIFYNPITTIGIALRGDDEVKIIKR